MNFNITVLESPYKARFGPEEDNRSGRSKPCLAKQSMIDPIAIRLVELLGAACLKPRAWLRISAFDAITTIAME